MTRVPNAGVLPLQKMFQCPYFFFDIVYIHNGSDEKEEEMSWKVRGAAGGCGRGVLEPACPRPGAHLRCAALEPWLC